jgi:lipopolysaccharide transport system ATP-binding protein
MTKVIEIENLSKLYDLGLVGTGTISRDLNRAWAKLRRKPDPYATLAELNDRTKKSNTGTVYALKDINFSVNQGEILGIIGKNGAGKSTLLKILSEITSPSTGQIKIKGRVASLLEVGTGMHPEMTAKQNIYLNGSLMGMKRHEITKRFDEIIDFSGINKYVDTPIKRFSSGMQVRLGFAVAAFLEPEILIVDEVLAVGDAEFQKKAIGKMKDVSKGEGRTVLFVSHVMPSIKTLCTKALLLENGTIKSEGNVDSIVNEYLSNNNSITEKNHKIFKTPLIAENLIIKELMCHSKNKKINDPILIGESIITSLKLEITNNTEDFHITYHLHDEIGNPMFSFSHMGDGLYPLKKGNQTLNCYFPNNFLNVGDYFLSIFIVKKRKHVILHEQNVIMFTVIDNKRSLGDSMGREPGNLRPSFNWENF